MRKLLSDVFGAQPDFECRVARNGVEALEVLAAYQPDVVTLDINMPRMDGLTCLDRIMIEHPCPVVMVSSLTEHGAEATLEAFHLGAVDFVAKPAGAISLGFAELAETLVAKVRGAAGAKPRASLRTHGARAASGRQTGPPPASPRRRGGTGRRRRQSWTEASEGCRHRRWVGPGRDFDRRSSRAGAFADRPAGELRVAHRGGAAHAGDVHGTSGAAVGRAVRAERDRGGEANAGFARVCLHREGRCRHRRQSSRSGNGGDAGSGGGGLSVASQRGSFWYAAR